MNTDTVGLNDFIGQGRSINLSIFKDLEKAITQEEFQSKYKGRVMFNPKMIGKFIEKVKEDCSELSKAGQSSEHILQKAKSDINSLEVVRVLTNEGISTVFVAKEQEEDSLEKGAITESIGYGDKAMSFSKTGKEIKEKVQGILTTVSAKCLEIKSEMLRTLEKCDSVPDEGFEEYERVPKECADYKKFSWGMCYYNDRNNGGSMELSVQEKPTAKTKESAECCNKYNSLLRKYCSVMADKEHAETLIRNIDEGKKYDMTLQQLSSFGF